MSKRMENMLDATLPPPPPVNDFMECLREVADGKAKPVEGDLFDGVFENEVDTVGKPAGTMGVHKTPTECVVVPAFSAKCAMHLTMSLAFMPPRLLLP